MEKISFSAWNVWKLGCPKRFEIEQIQKQYVPLYTVHLDFGTSIHLAFERYKTRKDPVPLEAAEKIFLEKFDELVSKNEKHYAEKDFSKMSKEEFRDAGIYILRNLHKCSEVWDADVIYNEHPLMESIERTDGLDIKFKGYIDLVIKTKDARGKTVLYIVDMKSCGWGWPKEKKQDPEVHAQVFLYKHFLCKKFDIDPKQVRCAFLLLKKKPKKNDPPVEFFAVSAGPVVVQRTLDQLNRDLSEITEREKTNDFPPNFKVCQNEWGDYCPHYRTERCPATRGH